MICCFFLNVEFFVVKIKKCVKEGRGFAANYGILAYAVRYDVNMYWDVEEPI